MSKAIEYCKNVFDGTHDTPKPTESGYKLLTSKNILNGNLDKANAYFISKEDYEAINKRSKVQQWDVLFSMIGTVGNVCLITEENIDFAIKNMGVFSCEDEKKAKWLYYYLQSPYAKQLMQNYLNGAIQKFLPLEWLRNLQIPDYDSSKENIVQILWSIDSKIVQNNSVYTELESMAKTLYDYWFTQFDFPNEEGKPYRSSGGAMEWNEQLKREIPSGWKTDNIQNTCSVIDCLHSQKPEQLYAAENYYLLQLENLVDLGLIDLHSKYYVSKDMYELWTSRIQVEDGDLVVTNAGRVGAVSRIPQHVIAGIGRNMTAIRPNTIPPFFLYYFFKSPDFSVQMRANTDSGAFFGSLNVRGIKQLLLTVPPASSDILKRFDSIVEPMRRKIESLQLENEELTRLRDWLLPMLMNGQATVE